MVWNIFHFPIYLECHHPKWRTHIFQRGMYTNHQPVGISGFLIDFLITLSWFGHVRSNLLGTRHWVREVYKDSLPQFEDSLMMTDINMCFDCLEIPVDIMTVSVSMWWRNHSSSIIFYDISPPVSPQHTAGHLVFQCPSAGLRRVKFMSQNPTVPPKGTQSHSWDSWMFTLW